MLNLYNTLLYIERFKMYIIFIQTYFFKSYFYLKTCEKILILTSINIKYIICMIVILKEFF